MTALMVDPTDVRDGVLATELGNLFIEEMCQEMREYRRTESIVCALSPSIEASIEDFEFENRMLWEDIRLQLNRVKRVAEVVDSFGRDSGAVFAGIADGSGATSSPLASVVATDWFELCFQRYFNNLAYGVLAIGGFGSDYVPYSQYTHRLYRERRLDEWPTRERTTDTRLLLRRFDEDRARAEDLFGRWHTAAVEEVAARDADGRLIEFGVRTVPSEELVRHFQQIVAADGAAFGVTV